MRSIKHERFDLAFFSSLFSLHELREQARTRPFLVPSGQIITSPFHLTTIELVRREVLGGTLPTGAVPVDVFVFGAGDPPAPHLTKIGGSPFRSRRKPWPTRRDGHPLGFV